MESPRQFAPAEFAREWSDYVWLNGQLVQYFKKSVTGIILSLLFSFKPLTFCKGTEAAIALSVFAVLPTAVPLLFAWGMPPQPGDSGDNQTPDVRTRRRLETLCCAAYFSNVLLMLTAVWLAALVDNRYWIITSPVLLTVFVLLGIFIKCGRQNGFIWGAVQYKSHQQPDLKFSLDLSSEVAQTAVVALSGRLFGNVKNGRCLQQGDSFRSVDGCIMYAVVVSIFLMLVSTIPPALDLQRKREIMVDKFLKRMAYVSLALVSLAEFLVAADVVQTYAVVAVALILAVGAIWFYMLLEDSSTILPSYSQGAEARHASREWSLVSLGIHLILFGMMMASYSAFLRGQNSSALYKFCIFFIFAAHLTNFSLMILERETRAKAVVFFLRIAMNVFIVLEMLILLAALFLVVLQPDQGMSTFIVT